MKKKVLFVINTLGRAGAEMALMELLKKLDPREYEVSLYVLLGQGELADRIPEYVSLKNKDLDQCSVLSEEGRKHIYKYILKAMFRRGNVFYRLPYMISALAVMIRNHKIWPDKLLWRVIADSGERFGEEYDLAVAYLEGGSTYYVADYVKAKKKAAFVHIDYTQAGYTRKLDRDCYLGFDAVFPIADEVRDKFLQVYPECKEKTVVFHNMLNQAEIKEKAELPGGFTDDFPGIRILTVGRLSYQKSYPVAIEAMRLLRQEGYEARWYVLGDGPERQNLEHQIASAGLEKDFILVGAVDNPYPYYAQTDIYVHATRFEGKSIAIQEAQILGCPIVASDSSGNREQITEGEDGTLCRLDPESVKAAIADLIQDKEKRLKFGRAAAEKKIAYEEDFALFTALLENED